MQHTTIVPRAEQRVGRFLPGRPQRSRAWISVLGGLDEALRRYYEVREYSTASDCVFRIALSRATRTVLLTDGTFIRAGDAVGTLHFWNEQLPCFPDRGPDIAWAKTMQNRVRSSLYDLGTFVHRDLAWAEVQGIRAEMALPWQRSAREQVRRVAGRYGFEVEAGHGELRSRLSLVAQNMLLWGFTRAYNPPAATRRRLVEGRLVLWLSRRTLHERYTEPAKSAKAAETPG